ncbi:sigma-70 family RNA polymerase sigma factor [Pseudanabaena sp. FACHB-1998]|uniref:sigma-70 family RNA polymerase sigma factor n=1 Tax=Pseudanabaena sp. FACHB-1998 TaxID=2692858 RepID=UPI0016815612|nr:sigma-70 family RNA polymerase sigma factor [Pseudanabaena sp. FACHB-1998]MBD2179416.1 sigma-70 family RNA polymerase sigma factor [Pseudanabaena sp. FACHB-1998]
MTDTLPLSIQPVISYPKEAEIGKTYLMEIDLQIPESGFEWQYKEEEYLIYCMVNAGNLFTVTSVGEPAIVLHRFGGTYGNAKFLIKAVKEEREGKIKISLVNSWGVTIRFVNLEKIHIRESLSSSQNIATKVNPFLVNKENKHTNSITVEDIVCYALENGNYNYAINKFIRRILIQHGLSTSLMFDILQEAYLLAQIVINPIVNPEAWIKSTSLNIVRKMIKQKDSHEITELDNTLLSSIPYKDYQNMESEILIKGHPISIYKTDLRKAWNNLSQRSQRILYLRLIDQLSWKQIATVISSEESKSISEDKMRQSGRRALSKLKEELLKPSNTINLIENN